MLPKLCHGLHRGLALVGKDGAGANGIRKGIVALTDQVRQRHSGAAPIASRQPKQGIGTGGLAPREPVEASAPPCSGSVSGRLDRGTWQGRLDRRNRVHRAALGATPFISRNLRGRARGTRSPGGRLSISRQMTLDTAPFDAHLN